MARDDDPGVTVAHEQDPQHSVRRPRRRGPGRWSVVVAAPLLTACGAVLVTGCTAVLPAAPGARAASSAVPPALAPGTAADALASVAVRGRAPRTGYQREEFGSGWVDTDGNGCDTRNDVLARDLTGVAYVPGTEDCVVASGTLADPYSATTIAFRRGQGTSERVQVDHVVALSDAWQKGAQGWAAGRRAAFANDPQNLLAVDGPLNAAKGDGDAATWLPPQTGYRCAFVARQVAVKARYGLWMTRAERDAVAGVLEACPQEPLPAVPSAATAEAPTPAAPVFTDCAAVRAAGAAPIAAGEPGYSPAFDGDGDGVGCEG